MVYKVRIHVGPITIQWSGLNSHDVARLADLLDEEPEVYNVNTPCSIHLEITGTDKG